VAEVLKRQGYVSAVDVLLHIGMLDKADYENWRMGRVPYLEKVVHGSLGKVSTVVRAMRSACREYGLEERWTDYRKWGKGAKVPLRFSKSGAPEIERAYATHFVSKRLAKEKAARKPTEEQPAAPKPATSPIEMNPERLRVLAKRKLQANLRLRQNLKFGPLGEEAIDAMFRRTAEEVSALVDCTQCARCCEELGPVLDDDDVGRLARRLDLTPEQVGERYLRREQGGLVFATLPCPFLVDRRCSVYEDRPEDCRSYPHLHKSDMVVRILGVIDGSGTCPIVYEVLERVRREVKRKGA
jgi:hypothetical protein